MQCADRDLIDLGGMNEIIPKDFIAFNSTEMYSSIYERDNGLSRGPHGQPGSKGDAALLVYNRCCSWVTQ